MPDELETAAEQRLGAVVAGRWRLERVLGVGGMAAVFLGRAGDGTCAALKILHPEVNAIEEARKRFLRESSIGNLLGAGGNDGFVRVFETGETEDGSAYIAMEPLEGESLFDRAVR